MIFEETCLKVFQTYNVQAVQCMASAKQMFIIHIQVLAFKYMCLGTDMQKYPSSIAALVEIFGKMA